MSALAIPQRLSVTRQNAAMCERLGVKVDGEDMGRRVIAYDIGAGVAERTGGEIKRGKIEPYWRQTHERAR